jgi:hypothetical protein
LLRLFDPQVISDCCTRYSSSHPCTLRRFRQQRGLLGLLLVRYLGLLDLEPVDQLVDPPLVDDLGFGAAKVSLRKEWLDSFLRSKVLLCSSEERSWKVGRSML